MFIETSESKTVRKSFGELLSQLSSDSAALLRDEIELAKLEMLEKAKALQAGFASIIIGAMIVQVALIALSAAAVIKLADSVSVVISAVLIGIGLSVVGGAIALSGIRKVKYTDLRPEKTIQTLKDGKEWLKQTV